MDKTVPSCMTFTFSCLTFTFRYFSSPVYRVSDGSQLHSSYLSSPCVMGHMVPSCITFTFSYLSSTVYHGSDVPSHMPHLQLHDLHLQLSQFTCLLWVTWFPVTWPTPLVAWPSPQVISVHLFGWVWWLPNSWPSPSDISVHPFVMDKMVPSCMTFTFRYLSSLVCYGSDDYQLLDLHL